MSYCATILLLPETSSETVRRGSISPYRGLKDPRECPERTAAPVIAKNAPPTGRSRRQEHQGQSTQDSTAATTGQYEGFGMWMPGSAHRAAAQARVIHRAPALLPQRVTAMHHWNLGEVEFRRRRRNGPLQCRAIPRVGRGVPRLAPGLEDVDQEDQEREPSRNDRRSRPGSESRSPIRRRRCRFAAACPFSRGSASGRKSR